MRNELEQSKKDMNVIVDYIKREGLIKTKKHSRRGTLSSSKFGSIDLKFNADYEN
jgi:hypothetical protein